VAPTAELIEADRAWVRSAWADLVPHAGGVGSYINFMSEFEEDRIRASYGAEKYQRLNQIKSQVRPGQPLPSQCQHTTRHGITARQISDARGAPIAVRRPRLTSPVRWREVRTAAPPVGDLDLPGFRAER
jgi:hypothetical protein